MSVSDAEVREALESVRSTTTNASVRRVVNRAIEMLDSGGVEAAAARLIDEIAETKRVEREILIGAPILLFVALTFLFHALRTLI